MSSEIKYPRVLLKLSGEALMGDSDYGIDPNVIARLAGEIKTIVDAGVQLGVVIGGGNIFRGAGLAASGMDRVTGDHMGMLATVINSLAMQEAVEKLGLKARVMSAVKINQMCEDYIRRRAIRHLEKGRVVPGITTGELDEICHDYIVNVQQAIPAPLNYRGFPKSICTSVNHQVCHGIPGDKKLKKGDIVNIDITVIKDEYHGDTSRMFFVGDTNLLSKRITRIAYECMWIGIDMVKPGVHLGDIGHAIQVHAESNRCSIVREYCGHGIGKVFHEDPQVLHYGKPGHGLILEPGMTFTIEPMVNVGKRHTRLLSDQWTVVTKDRSLSAQWEHTILVTTDGHEVLTLSPTEEGRAAPPDWR